MTKKPRVFSKITLSIPKPVWIAIISLVLGATCSIVSELTWFAAHHSIKNCTLVAGNSLLSAAVLLLLLQLPVIRNEIENYFITAFSSSDFVRNFRPQELTELIRNLLHARYEPTADEGYVDTAVNLMDNFVKPYVSFHTENIHLRISEHNVCKHITKICTIILRHLSREQVDMVDLLNRRIVATRVLFESATDSRRFDRLIIKINNEKVLDLTADILTAKDGTGEFLTNEILNVRQFDHASVANWHILAKRCPDLDQLKVSRGQVVTVISSEWRETGIAGASFSHRFHYMTHAPRVFVNVDGESENRRIRGFIYGNGLRPENVSVLDGPNSIVVQTDGWLYPGCGYTIIVDESGKRQRETEEVERCDSEKKKVESEPPLEPRT